ncbi:hypothetical protein MP228_000097 [Amoeboaphelidium protococcarum]|nr:hypothetical protein MP228_000097 [Amoeboaphelidium protococcarum]
MGKRKSTRAPVKRQKQTLDKTFTCLFCNHESAIAVRIVKDQQIGTVNCRMCGVNWSCKITPLDEAIDVYANWVDACEDAQQQQHLQQPMEQFIRGGGGGGAPSVPQRSLQQQYINRAQQSAGRVQVQSQKKSAISSGIKSQPKQQNNKPIQKRNRSDSVDSFVTNDSDDDGEFGQDAGEDGSDIDQVSIQGGSGEEEEEEEAVETEDESEGDDNNDQAIAQSRKLVSSKLGDRPQRNLSDDDDLRQQSADNIQPESSNIPKRRAIISDDDDD